MKRVIDLLKKLEVITVATSLNDKPRASVVDCYVVDNGSIIFATSPESIKANNLKHNKRVSVSVCQMPLFATIDGTVTTPTESEIKGYGKRLFEKHPEFKQMAEAGMIQPFVYFKVIVETAYYNDFTNGMTETEVIHNK